MKPLSKLVHTPYGIEYYKRNLDHDTDHIKGHLSGLPSSTARELLGLFWAIKTWLYDNQIDYGINDAPTCYFDTPDGNRVSVYMMSYSLSEFQKIIEGTNKCFVIISSPVLKIDPVNLQDTFVCRGAVIDLIKQKQVGI